MPRLFFAITPPEFVGDDLDGLCEGIPRARWGLEVGYHLTLVFLGDVPEHRVGDVVEAADSIRTAPFELRLDGAGVFPRRGDPRVLWLGLERSAELTRLARLLRTELSHAGFELEKRKFHPHLTLARTQNSPPAAVADWLTHHVAYRSERFRVSRFELVSSVLRPHGSLYTEEASFVLGPGG